MEYTSLITHKPLCPTSEEGGTKKRDIFSGILFVRYNLLLANIHACMSHVTERAEGLIQKLSLASGAGVL